MDKPSFGEPRPINMIGWVATLGRGTGWFVSQPCILAQKSILVNSKTALFCLYKAKYVSQKAILSRKITKKRPLMEAGANICRSNICQQRLKQTMEE